MAASIQWIDLEEGQIPFKQGDAAEAMYLVREGMLQAHITDEGCVPMF